MLNYVHAITQALTKQTWRAWQLFPRFTRVIGQSTKSDAASSVLARTLANTPTPPLPEHCHAQVCVEHVTEDMISLVMVHQCAHEDCTKLPSFGMNDGAGATFCAKHADEHMIKLANIRKCSQQGYEELPTHGIPNSKKRQVSQSKPMVDAIPRRNSYDCNL